MNKWLTDFTLDEIEASAGFVYEIEHLPTGRKYIGRKYTTLKRGKTYGKSNWQRYWGSCRELKKDIEKFGVGQFRRTILSIHRTRPEVNYEEVRMQFERDVLRAVLSDGSRAFYNGSIVARYIAPRGRK